MGLASGAAAITRFQKSGEWLRTRRWANSCTTTYSSRAECAITTRQLKRNVPSEARPAIVCAGFRSAPGGPPPPPAEGATPTKSRLPHQNPPGSSLSALPAVQTRPVCAATAPASPVFSCPMSPNVDIISSVSSAMVVIITWPGL